MSYKVIRIEEKWVSVTVLHYRAKLEKNTPHFLFSTTMDIHWGEQDTTKGPNLMREANSKPMDYFPDES